MIDPTSPARAELPPRPYLAVIGKDARTEALASGCAASELRPRIIGISEIDSPGLTALSERFCRVASLRDLDEVLAALAAGGEEVSLAIVGPEDLLCAGLADRLEEELAIPCFGPRRDHARVEASKSWARELLSRHGIRGNPEHRVFRPPDGPAELAAYLRQLGDFVVKPDGLTGGKGVKVSGDHLSSIEEGAAYAAELLGADGVVVVEERMEGEEFSLQTVTDGTTCVHCPLVQDHKRAYEGDTGPNTGGMGSYSMPDHSMPWLDGDDAEAARRINEAVVRALGTELGTPYRGVLYGGFMATTDGVRVVEYNARFGDPEATNVLPVLRSDLVEVCWAAATGRLRPGEIEFGHQASVCKYVVPEWYPGPAPGPGPAPAPAPRGGVVTAPATIDASALAPLVGDGSVRLYWASVNVGPAGITMTGSRALAVVGIGDTLEEAERQAERAASLVSGPVRHRRDIGTADALLRRCEHMERLRLDH